MKKCRKVPEKEPIPSPIPEPDLIIEAMPHKLSGYSVSPSEVGPMGTIFEGQTDRLDYETITEERGHDFRFTVQRSVTHFPFSIDTSYKGGRKKSLFDKVGSISSFASMTIPVRSPTSDDLIPSVFESKKVVNSGIGTNDGIVNNSDQGRDSNLNSHPNPGTSTPVRIAVSEVQADGKNGSRLKPIENAFLPSRPCTNSELELEKFKPSKKRLE
ncbi:uncharacterized protein LOC127880143 [Dreissena polymorpha]|uniref:Uncharacterized protein n=1 Tax=Dreissena polymorpha TaxID=45954 RepID=A0A9D4KHB0_DREPO|nr:uncharacterized protein LOC127880143 [Dreissena polymorpha]KAH3839873.1 hypothetical protein DPMN_113312 [Dreissena polymorpha]